MTLVHEQRDAVTQKTFGHVSTSNKQTITLGHICINNSLKLASGPV